MKKHASTLCRIAIVTSMVAFSHAQEESSEPIELTRLREQFSNRIEQEMKPWRDRYAQELQKLEDRLIKERKLTEALAVKKEKDNYLTADLTKKPEKPTIPATAEKAREAMIGTVWLVYDAADKKRENLLDTYHFVDGKNVFVLTSKRVFPWNATSKEKSVIEFLAGNIAMDVYFDDQSADSNYQGRLYKLFLVGKTTVR
jgi:hypothetical protein